jgi:hypothetical protein
LEENYLPTNIGRRSFVMNLRKFVGFVALLLAVSAIAFAEAGRNIPFYVTRNETATNVSGIEVVRVEETLHGIDIIYKNTGANVVWGQVTFKVRAYSRQRGWVEGEDFEYVNTPAFSARCGISFLWSNEIQNVEIQIIND